MTVILNGLEVGVTSTCSLARFLSFPFCPWHCPCSIGRSFFSLLNPHIGCGVCVQNEGNGVLEKTLGSMTTARSDAAGKKEKK